MFAYSNDYIMVDRKAGHYCSVAVRGLSGHILESRIFGQKSIIQNKDFKILVKIAGYFNSIQSNSVVKIKSKQICMPHTAGGTEERLQVAVFNTTCD